MNNDAYKPWGDVYVEYLDRSELVLFSMTVSSPMHAERFITQMFAQGFLMKGTTGNKVFAIPVHRIQQVWFSGRNYGEEAL